MYSESEIKQLLEENKALKEQNTYLTEQSEALTQQMEKMTETINYLTRKLFGRKSEKANVICEGQLTMDFLFNEAETVNDPKAEEPVVEEVTYTRRKKQKGKRKADLSGLPHQKVIHGLAEEDRVCPKCGKSMKVIGETFIRSEVVFMPAKLFVKDHVRESYECIECRKTEEKANIIKAPVHQPVIAHSFASPSSVAWVMYQKFVNAVPLARQEKDWKAMGVPLSKATMANWMIITAREYLIPLKNRMLTTLKKEPVIHADETPVQVMKEEDRTNVTKSYMWVYTSGYDSKNPIRIFDYRPGRGGKYPREMLRGFKGILQTDGYSGYDQIPDVTRALCWAHLRRNFTDALPAEKSEQKDTLAYRGFSYCSALFEMEKEILKLNPDDRSKARHEKDEKLLKTFFDWAETSAEEILPKSKTGEAINYALNHKQQLMNFMDNGYAVISNNIAENAIRPFTVGRKNWLFCGSPKGADASAAIYSIVETAKANHLDPYLYCLYLFTELPGCDIKKNPSILDDMMPWTDLIQKRCKEGLERSF